MTETGGTKKDRPRTGDAGRRPGPDSVVTDGAAGLWRLKEVMRRILQPGKHADRAPPRPKVD